MVLIWKKSDRALWGDKNILYFEVDIIIHLITFIKILQGIYIIICIIYLNFKGGVGETKS